MKFKLISTRCQVELNTKKIPVKEVIRSYHKKGVLKEASGFVE